MFEVGSQFCTTEKHDKKLNKNINKQRNALKTLLACKQRHKFEYTHTHTLSLSLSFFLVAFDSCPKCGGSIWNVDECLPQRKPNPWQMGLPVKSQRKYDCAAGSKLFTLSLSLSLSLSTAVLQFSKIFFPPAKADDLGVTVIQEISFLGDGTLECHSHRSHSIQIYCFYILRHIWRISNNCSWSRKLNAP